MEPIFSSTTHTSVTDRTGAPAKKHRDTGGSTPVWAAIEARTSSQRQQPTCVATMYRVAGLLLIWLAGAEETEDCAMTQLRKVNEHHQADSEETTDERSQSANPFQNMCPTPCVKDEAMKTCKQNKGYSFKTDTCSFKCNGKGQVQNWKGPTLATLVKNPCKDTTNGPAAFCKKNPSELLSRETKKRRNG
ncbi:unnamed protein product [Durusdinium trenchii]|uniref:Uncharacterized protein n=1 Tax=Durusdinium trenchii TaxID=1381693 RepID=A0ABP0Q809_9DINO